MKKLKGFRNYVNFNERIVREGTREFFYEDLKTRGQNTRAGELNLNYREGAASGKKKQYHLEHQRTKGPRNI